MIDHVSPPLYLFAKAPIPGKVKTRLQSRLGSEGCADLAIQMLYQSVKKVAQHWPGKFILCVTPDQDDPHFVELSNQYHCALIKQQGVSLGDRILGALRQGIADAGAAAVMGCDVPQIPGDVLANAWKFMQLGDNVLGPAADGGFYLLGLHSLRPEIFEEIEWGGAKVLDRMIRQSEKIGLDFRRLDMLRDIDRWEDLKWLATHDSQYASYLNVNLPAAKVTSNFSDSGG